MKNILHSILFMTTMMVTVYTYASINYEAAITVIGNNDSTIQDKILKDLKCGIPTRIYLSQGTNYLESKAVQIDNSGEAKLTEELLKLNIIGGYFRDTPACLNNNIKY